MSEGFLSRAHEDERLREGERVLRRFHEEEARAPWAPTAVEEEFAFLLERNRVQGRYDLVIESEGEVAIVDFKTGDVRDPKAAQKRAAESLQLDIYALAHLETRGRLARPRRAALPGVGPRRRADAHGRGGRAHGRAHPRRGGGHPAARVPGAADVARLQPVPVPRDLPAHRVGRGDGGVSSSPLPVARLSRPVAAFRAGAVIYRRMCMRVTQA